MLGIIFNNSIRFMINMNKKMYKNNENNIFFIDIMIFSISLEIKIKNTHTEKKKNKRHIEVCERKS